MDNASKALQTIEKSNIKPRSTFFFGILKFLNYTILAAGIMVIITLLCLAVLNILEAGYLASLITLPIIVLVILSLFVFIILFQKASRSDDFYKYPRFKFAGILIGVIISGMIIWNITGTAKASDIALQDSREYCLTMKKAVYVKWSSPKDGYLAGEVQEQKPVSPMTFTLKDLRRNLWEIHPGETVNFEVVDRGELVKLRGEQLDINIFRANELYPWEGKMWFDILE